MNSTFAASSRRLQQTIDAAMPALRAFGDDAASRPRAPGKWSPKQILGHLVDSAANNHQRFVRAQQGPALVLPGYMQEHWVGVQGYDESSWPDIVALWSSYNRHLVQVIARIPERSRELSCTIGDDEPVTLAFLAADYVDHIWHHLRQIGIAPPAGVLPA